MKQLVLKQDEKFEKKLKINSELVKIINVPFKELRKEIQKSKEKIIVSGGDEKVNRLAVESKKVDILLSPELNSKKDSFFVRKSGLNQVLCKLAYENKVAIGFNFSEILNSKGKERSKILGRMVHNVKMCRKYKVKMIISTFAKDKYELRSLDALKSFGKVIGMSPDDVKISFL